MIEKFFASLITNVSEQMLTDLFRAILREIMLNRKKNDITQTVDALKAVLAEVSTAGMTDDEKNTRLADAGRAVIERMRKP
jgi:hypothetical protein